MPKDWGVVQGGVWRKVPKDKHRRRRHSRSRSPSPARHHSRRHESGKSIVVPEGGIFLPPGKYYRASSPTGHSRRSRSSRKPSTSVRPPSTRSPSPSYRSDQSDHTVRSGNVRYGSKGREYDVPVPAGRSVERSYHTDLQGYGHDSYHPPPSDYRAASDGPPQVTYSPEQATYQHQQPPCLPPPAPTTTPSVPSPSASMAAIPSAPTPIPNQYSTTLGPFHHPPSLATTPRQQPNNLRPPPVGALHRSQPSVPMHEAIPQIRLPPPLARTNPPSPNSHTWRIYDIRIQALEADTVSDKLPETLAKQEKPRREIIELEEQDVHDASEANANADARRLVEQKVDLLQARASRSHLAPEPHSNTAISLPSRSKSPPATQRARSALPTARFGGDSSLSGTEQKVESRSHLAPELNNHQNQPLSEKLDSPPPMGRARPGLPDTRVGRDSPPSGTAQKITPLQDRASRSGNTLEPENNNKTSSPLPDRSESPPPMRRARSALPTARVELGSLLPGGDTKRRPSLLGVDEGYASHDDRRDREGDEPLLAEDDEGSAQRQSSSFADGDGGDASSREDRRRAPSSLLTGRPTSTSVEGKRDSEDCDVAAEIARIHAKAAKAGRLERQEAIRQLEQCLRDVKTKDADGELGGLVREGSRNPLG